MACHEDLSPFADFGSECAACLRAIGWLERGRSFTTGAVDPTVYARLVELLRHPWEPVITVGFHV